jgi:hypothetical protein
MPRVKRNPELPLFDFKTNPDKKVSERTVKSYKKHLQDITDWSVFENERDSSVPIIKTRADLLAHPKSVIGLINEHTEKRLTKCGFYSAIFYILGRQDLDKDITTLPYVYAFREVYYSDTYKAKLRAEGKLPPLADAEGKKSSSDSIDE